MYVYIDVKDVNSRYKLFAHKSHRPGTGTRRQQISAQRPDRAIKLLNNFPHFSETIYIYIYIIIVIIMIIIVIIVIIIQNLIFQKNAQLHNS